MNNDTREWKDGVLTATARAIVASASQSESLTHHYVVSDGDIDPEWIESLNSVLDDNHLLTLPNGERFQFTDNVNFVFETHDLQYASPATVSRMGMIFVSENDVDLTAIVQAWWQKQAAERQPVLQPIVQQHLPTLLQKVSKLPTVIQTSTVGTLKSVLLQLQSCTSNSGSEYTTALVRGLTSNLMSTEDKRKVSELIYTTMSEKLSVDQKKQLLNVYFNAQVGAYELYQPTQTTIEMEELKATHSHSKPAVMTVDLQRSVHTMKNWLQSSSLQSILLVGPSGCGRFKLLP